MKAVEAPGTVSVDDAFAKSLGLESLDKLKEAVKARLQQEHAGLSRQRVKRQLLDKLDEMHKFALPPTLAEEEFNNVWNAVENDLKAQGRTFEDEGTTEEKAREEYRGIAERRVRLGLVLAEIGEKNKITGDRGGAHARHRRARAPGARPEQEVWDYYRKNPDAVAAVARADLRGEGGRLPASSSPPSPRSRSRARNSSRTTRTKSAPVASGCAPHAVPWSSNVRRLFCPRVS